jgi:hypothetical protein
MGGAARAIYASQYYPVATVLNTLTEGKTTVPCASKLAVEFVPKLLTISTKKAGTTPIFLHLNTGKVIGRGQKPNVKAAILSSRASTNCGGTTVKCHGMPSQVVPAGWP